jgi:hypothetical protein
MDDNFFAKTMQFLGIFRRKLRKSSKTVIEFRAAEIRVQSFPGCLGLAILVGDHYWILHINQYALLSRALLSSDTHELSPGPGTVGDVADQQPISISSLAAISSYPHSFISSQLPTISNPHNLLGKSGDQATIAYNRSSGQWELLQVHPATLRSFRFKLTNDFPVGASATTSNYTIENSAAGHADGDVLDPLPSLKDTYSLAMGAKVGDTGVAAYDWKLEGWIIESISHEATMFCGTLDWHFFHCRELLKQYAVGIDWDGVLNVDCPRECDDDGRRYQEWLDAVRPIRRPDWIPTIITARLEAYRDQCLQWLARYRIECDQLVMFPGSFAERAKTNIGLWKASMCDEHGVEMFVESDLMQAQTIATKRNKLTLSIERPQ